MSIFDRAREGHAPTKEECAYMLSFPAFSYEASLIRATADSVTRQRYGNEGMVFAQIGFKTLFLPSGKQASFNIKHH